MKTFFHKPVMLQEVLAALDPKPGQHFIDATLGAGGHAEAILKRIAPNGKLIGIERDPEMLALARERLASFGSRLISTCVTYDRMREVITMQRIGQARKAIPLLFAGVIFDLGMSSWHLEHSGRGFSFLRDEPLDMRFNPATAGQTAADLLQNLSEEELTRVFEEYGEEPYAKRVAAAIVRERKHHAITTTSQLAALTNLAIPARLKRSGGPRRRRTQIHAATKIFQALRIAVNDELEYLAAGLKAAEKSIEAGGKIVVIAFHGLEARIIKNTFRRWEKERKGERASKHAIAPLREEIRVNPRARSAHLYCFQHV